MILHKQFQEADSLLLMFLFVCWGLTSRLNISDYIATVSAYSSGTLTNVLPHRNAMPQTQDITPHPVIVYKHRDGLSLFIYIGIHNYLILCYPLAQSYFLFCFVLCFFFRCCCVVVCGLLCLFCFFVFCFVLFIKNTLKRFCRWI